MLLIVHHDKRKSRSLSDIFYHMGVVSYAISADEIRDELSEAYRALIVIDPLDIANLSEILRIVRSYKAQIPTFAVTDGYLDENISKAFDCVIEGNVSPAAVLARIIEYQDEHDLKTSAQYKIAGINASCDSDEIKIFESRISFTKTETMILRYLIGSYPSPKDAECIIKYAFKQLRAPDPTSIRTHVSAMNKKIRDVYAKNIFLCIPGKGYVISTPETIPSDVNSIANRETANV